MTSREDTERIVNEVMRRLASPCDVAAPQKQEDRTCLRISDAVVSLSTLDGRLAQVRQVHVPPAAVVTPAVKDLLRQKRIELIRDSSGDSPPGRSVPRLVVANLSPTLIVDWNAAGSCEMHSLKADSLDIALAKMASELRRLKSLGLILTDLPEIAVCLASRNAHIRAVHGLSERIVKRAVSTMAANLLVIEPQVTTDFEFRSVMTTFLHAPRRTDVNFATRRE